MERPVWCCQIQNHYHLQPKRCRWQPSTTPLLWRYSLKKNDSMALLGLTLNNNLSWNQLVTKMSKIAGQQLELSKRVTPYIPPAQRAIIYKALIRLKMKYASSAWIGATAAQLDSIQNRAKRVIGLPKQWVWKLSYSAAGPSQCSWSSRPRPSYVLQSDPQSCYASWLFFVCLFCFVLFCFCCWWPVMPCHWKKINIFSSEKDKWINFQKKKNRYFNF